MKHDELFRPEALQALQSPERLGLTLRAVPPAALYTLAVLAMVLAAAVAAACIVTVPIQVRAEAILISSKGMLELAITAQNEGRIVEVLVGDRSRVAPGDVIARIDRPELRLELGQAESEREQLMGSIEAINRLQTDVARASKDIREQLLAQATAGSQLLEDRLNSLQQLTKAVDELKAKGIVTIDRTLSVRSDIADTRERLNSKYASPLNLAIDELNQKGQFKREQIQLEERLVAVQHRIAKVTAQLVRESVVVSREYGVVSEVKVAPGDLVKFDTPIVSLLPTADTLYRERPGPARLIAAVFLPAHAGKKVTPGMSALVDPLSVRRDVYGNMTGEVREVSDVPITPERMRQMLRNDELVRRLSANGVPFLALVSLKADRESPSGFAWTSSGGPPNAITAGTLAEVQITTERVTLIGLVIPAIKELFRGFDRFTGSSGLTNRG
jgi:HlyD family secretion protein